MLTLGLSGVAVAGFTGKAGSVVADPSPFSIELVKRGDGPVVKDGDYAMIDFTGWLDGFQGKQVVDSSTANEGQMVKVPIGEGAGLLRSRSWFPCHWESTKR